MSEQTSNPTSGQNVPKSKFRRKSRQEQTAASKLRMERRGEKLDAAREKLAKQKPPKKPGAVKRLAHTAGHGVHGFVHGKLYEVEHENVGTEGAHRSELAAESVYRFGRRKLRKAIREHPAKAVERAESKHIKATADYYYRKTVEEHPEMQEGGAVSRYLQKQKIKRQYAKQAREAARQTAKAAEGTASVTGKLAEKVSAYIKEHPGGLLLLLAAFLLLVVLQSCMSSLVTVGNGVAGAIGASTYAAEDADLLGAEAAYCALEDELQRYLDTYTRTHDYDEYHFDLDTIEHDPYVLLSIVCALHEGEWTLDEVRGTLQMLFDRQYILTEDVVVEVRYRTVTRTDSEGNNYDVEVPYNYYICYVTLENFNLSHLPVYIMGEETLSRYALYMATLGNRPDLFPSSPYVGKYTSKPPAHEIPEDYLADETFAAILKEAEKYVGYPYVWGGSSPSTSFDCSGFVSYVYNQCGWSLGRLGAQGLYNICSRTSSPRPGDLVFFVGTYDTAGISHVGIYVGDGWMLHCGDPISYANLNSRATGSPISTPTENCFDRRFFMAISKSAKIQAEIEKVTAKINEQQARLKELEQKKLEAENSEIVEIVRGMSVSPSPTCPLLLQHHPERRRFWAQNGPKPDGYRRTANEQVDEEADCGALLIPLLCDPSAWAVWRSRPTPGAARNGTALPRWSRCPPKPLTPARASPRTATL